MNIAGINAVNFGKSRSRHGHHHGFNALPAPVKKRLQREFQGHTPVVEKVLIRAAQNVEGAITPAKVLRDIHDRKLLPERDQARLARILHVELAV
jgi:hypothetical protein